MVLSYNHVSASSFKCILEPQSRLQNTTTPADILATNSSETLNHNHQLSLFLILVPQKLQDNEILIV